jgi:hypothetical protein
VITESCAQVQVLARAAHHLAGLVRAQALDIARTGEHVEWQSPSAALVRQATHDRMVGLHHSADRLEEWAAALGRHADLAAQRGAELLAVVAAAGDALTSGVDVLRSQEWPWAM